MKRKNHKIILASVLWVLLMVSLCACREETFDITQEKLEHATLVLKEDGTFQSGVTSSFEEDYYSVDKLTAYVNEQVAEYTKEHSGASITVTQVKAEDKMATVILTFTSIDDYAGFFNDAEAYVGTVGELSGREGWPGEFTSAKKGESVQASELKSESRGLMLTPNVETTNVKVEGKILYVAGGILLDNNTVQIEAGQAGCIVYE